MTKGGPARFADSQPRPGWALQESVPSGWESCACLLSCSLVSSIELIFIDHQKISARLSRKRNFRRKNFESSWARNFLIIQLADSHPIPVRLWATRPFPTRDLKVKNSMKFRIDTKFRIDIFIWNLFFSYFCMKKLNT